MSEMVSCLETVHELLSVPGILFRLIHQTLL